MGASIYYKPSLKIQDKHLDIGPRSRFVTKIVEKFGSYPIKLSRFEINKLREIADEMEDLSVYKGVKQLIKAIEQHDEIILDVVY